MHSDIERAVSAAQSEEDIRFAFAKSIDGFISKADLSLDSGKHEYRAGKGSIDSKYGFLFIEYKNPKNNSRLNQKRNSASVKKLIEQIKSRFDALYAQDKMNKNRILGIGTDGNYLIFVKHSQKRYVISDPLPVTEVQLQRLLRSVVSIGSQGISYTATNLAHYLGTTSMDTFRLQSLDHSVLFSFRFSFCPK